MSVKQKNTVKIMITDVLLYFVSGCIFAVAVRVFTAPNKIAPGGVTGISTMLNYAFGLPIGLVTFLLNVPIFIFSLMEIGYKIVTKTIVASFLTSFAIDWFGSMLPAYKGDPMLAAIFGGLLEGVSLAMVFRRGATTGGTDMVARLLQRHFRHLSTGRLMMSVDVVVVISSAIVYRRIESVLYAVIYLFVSTNVIDEILYGSDIGRGKILWIVTQYPDGISQRIFKEVDRGVTAIHSKGMYSGREGEVLMCAVSRSEIYQVMDLVKDEDKDAFIIAGEAAQIRGEGFRSSAPVDKTLPEILAERKNNGTRKK
ncbi:MULTISPECIES: YitT family protein [Caproicibacterium]|nr:YitT family protein [Caproicibacterium lactatifermentans]MDD4808195.1 YitT family protein [Oscillospiraceae bacterium]